MALERRAVEYTVFFIVSVGRMSTLLPVRKASIVVALDEDIDAPLANGVHAVSRVTLTTRTLCFP